MSISRFGMLILVFAQLILGSYADFGTFRPNILIVLSLIAWGIGFGWLGVHHANQWQTGIGLYIVGLIAYQLCLTYWTAAFPGLARNTRLMREKAQEFEEGVITRDEYDYADSMKRNELSNVAFYIQSVGEIVILAVIVGVMFGVKVNASTANNNWGLSVYVTFTLETHHFHSHLLFADILQPHSLRVWSLAPPSHPMVHPRKAPAGSRSRHEHRPRRLLATLLRLDADLAFEAIALLSDRLLLARGLTQYNCDGDWDVAE